MPTLIVWGSTTKMRAIVDSGHVVTPLLDDNPRSVLVRMCDGFRSHADSPVRNRAIAAWTLKLSSINSLTRARTAAYLRLRASRTSGHISLS